MVINNVRVRHAMFIGRTLVPVMNFRTFTSRLTRNFTRLTTHTRTFRNTNGTLTMRQERMRTNRTRIITFLTFRRFATTTRINNRTETNHHRQFRRQRELTFKSTNRRHRVRFTRMFSRVRTSNRFGILRFGLFRRLVTFINVILIIRAARSIRPSVIRTIQRFTRHISRNFRILSKDRARRNTSVRPAILELR